MFLHSTWFLLLLLPTLISTQDASPNLPIFANLSQKNGYRIYTCGESVITSELYYCTPTISCSRAGIIREGNDLKKDKQSFAVCAEGGEIQIRISKSPAVWKHLDTINCVDNTKSGGNISIVAKFSGKLEGQGDKRLRFNDGADLRDIALRCRNKLHGRARFDIYHYSERKVEDEEGVYLEIRIYLIYCFNSVLITLLLIGLYYTFFLCTTNKKLKNSVAKRQQRHDELWLSLERIERSSFDFEETWSAMPLLDQQIAAEAALFLQKYKTEKFTPHLRQWIVDRGYPAGATEVIIAIAGLSDPECPTYATLERKKEFKPDHKLLECADRIEARIVDTLNYCNRLKRRKIVFTDHRWLDVHHLFIELFLTSLIAPSHPTMHDAVIPIMPRHAFGTKDDPREEKKQEKESQARLRRTNFVQYNWDEAQRLLAA